MLGLEKIRYSFLLQAHTRCPGGGGGRGSCYANQITITEGETDRKLGKRGYQNAVTRGYYGLLVHSPQL